MWRKTSEAKPGSAASNTPAPAPTKPRETPQATSQPASPAPVAATPAPPAPAPVAPAKTASVTSALAPEPAASGSASTISAGLRIKGDITGTADLTVDGETHGKIRITNGRMTVGPNGRVNADIEAREIVVLGTVHGNLKASESIRLGSASRVEGSVLTPRIGIDDGARLRGNVEMVRAGETPDAANLETAKAAQAVRAVSASPREE
jgi:cytoskeletal protein CcmA (bactofilin family)